MKNDNFNEHRLDSLLDSESEEEFGEPEVKDRFDHGADDSIRGNLRDWSAQDFASIYVRFRPHLERHAKRYLSNPVQAEEVVQDAFLYLMTSLPEMDSELGVLKFLKWKIRLLCFDVLRSASNLRETSVPEHAEYASNDPDFTADLERAEDNAVIRMALARLNPRQREALVASVYQEKSSEEVAEQLGLSPNAARQLLFRARSAFRKALIGEAEIQGKSASQVLSIAAKKAALEAKENAVKVGAFFVLAAIGFGAAPAIISSDENLIADRPVFETRETSEGSVQPQLGNAESSGGLSSDVAKPNTVDTPKVFSGEDDEVIAEELVQIEINVDNDGSVETVSGSQDLSTQRLGTILTTDVTNAGFYTNGPEGLSGILFQGTSLEVFGGTGISAFLDFDVESKSVRQIVFQMNIDGDRYYGLPKSMESENLKNGNGHTIAVVSKEFYVVDEQSNVFSESPLADSKAVVTLELAEDGTPQSASMKVESLR